MHTIRRISLFSLFCLSCAVTGGAAAEPSVMAQMTRPTPPSQAVARPLVSVPQFAWQALPTATPPAVESQGQWLRISDDGDTETAQQPPRPQRWVF